MYKDTFRVRWDSNTRVERTPCPVKPAEALIDSSVKALDTAIICHGVDFRLLASASSDGEVKTWTMRKDGNVTENGSYDSGNRLMCLVLHDAAIEQLDSRSISAKNDNTDSEKEADLSSNSEESKDEEEWNGIEEA